MKHYGPLLSNREDACRSTRASLTAGHRNWPQENGHTQPNNDDITEAEEWVHSRFNAGMMVSVADNRQYAPLKIYLENRYVVDYSDKYLIDTIRLLSQMNNFRVTATTPNHNIRQHVISSLLY